MTAAADQIDGRVPGLTLEARDALRALAETHLQLIEAGLLHIEGMR